MSAVSQLRRVLDRRGVPEPQGFPPAIALQHVLLRRDLGPDLNMQMIAPFQVLGIDFCRQVNQGSLLCSVITTCSSLGPSGTLTGHVTEIGTRSNSALPPGNASSMCE